MDILFEFLFDLVFEGTLAVSADRRVAPWIRYPLIVLIGLLFAAAVAVIMLAGILVMEDSVPVGVLILALGAAFAFFAVRKFYRVYVEKCEKWD